jgi:NTE family protein
MFVLYCLFLLICSCFSHVCNILSLSGGGALGAIQLGILDNIYLPSYDLISGISIGSINAVFLAQSNNITYNLNFIQNILFDIHNSDIYTPIGHWSMYNNKPLNNTLHTFLNFSLKTPILIGASNLNTDKLDLFLLNQFDKDAQINLLLASSAIPLLFPPVYFNNSIYVDGGLIHNFILHNFYFYLPYCHLFNITLITTSNTQYIPINSFPSFINHLIHSLLISSNHIICQHNYIIHHYFPTFDTSNISLLDFEKSHYLFNLGKHNFNFRTYLCNNILI